MRELNDRAWILLQGVGRGKYGRTKSLCGPLLLLNRGQPNQWKFTIYLSCLNNGLKYSCGLSPSFLASSLIRNKLYDWNFLETKFELHTIGVGNLSVGGRENHWLNTWYVCCKTKITALPPWVAVTSANQRFCYSLRHSARLPILATNHLFLKASTMLRWRWMPAE